MKIVQKDLIVPQNMGFPVFVSSKKKMISRGKETLRPSLYVALQSSLTQTNLIPLNLPFRRHTLFSRLNAGFV